MLRWIFQYGEQEMTLNKNQAYELINKLNQINREIYDRYQVAKDVATIFKKLQSPETKKFRYPLLFIYAHHLNTGHLDPVTAVSMAQSIVEMNGLTREEGAEFGAWLAQNLNDKRFEELNIKLKRLAEVMPIDSVAYPFWNATASSFSNYIRRLTG